VGRILLLLLVVWLPWKPGRIAELAKIPIVTHNPLVDDCQRAWINSDAIHLCGERSEYPWHLSHEMQHYFVGRDNGLREADWDKFTNVALKELMILEEMGLLGDGEWEHAKYVGHEWGGGELHAELPWITRGYIPPKLAIWYPWFRVSDAR
jgi:hypothetical protein